MVVANRSSDAITSAGPATVGEERTTHVAQRSHRRGGFETVTDAVADDEATASFTEVEDVVPVAADGEVAGFGQVPCGHGRQVRGQLQHGMLQRVADAAEGSELVGSEQRCGHRGRHDRLERARRTARSPSSNGRWGLVATDDDRPQRRVVDRECHPGCRSTRFPLVVQHDRDARVRHVADQGMIGRLGRGDGRGSRFARRCPRGRRRSRRRWRGRCPARRRWSRRRPTRSTWLRRARRRGRRCS